MFPRLREQLLPLGYHRRFVLHSLEGLLKSGKERIVLAGCSDRDTQTAFKARPRRTITNKYIPINQTLPNIAAIDRARSKQYEIGTGRPHIDIELRKSCD